MIAMTITYIYIFIKQVVPNTVAHHQMIDAQPVPEQWLPPQPTPLSFIVFHRMSCGIENPFSQLRSTGALSGES